MDPRPSILSPARPSLVVSPPGAPTAPHPRRPPAHRSVSLLHSRRSLSRESPQAPSQHRLHATSPMLADKRERVPFEHPQNDSPSSLQVVGGNGSSGESNDPHAEKWFEKSNNQVREKQSDLADNEPPYFLHNSSSSETPPEGQTQGHKHGFSLFPSVAGTNSLPLRAGHLNLGGNVGENSSDEYRGLIDDLTVENKKLKRRLKKYEKLHDSHLKKEKLFEVRFHSLSAEKKLQLESTLREFASTLQPSDTAFNPISTAGLALPSSSMSMKAVKSASPITSGQNTDSAYASHSASGQDVAQRSRPTDSAGQQNVQSYLQDQAPRFNGAYMSERSKRKLVVRRLEQIFAGKVASVGGHQQPIQQQEVSRLAAQADTSPEDALYQSTRPEGTREAFIMGEEMEDVATDPHNVYQNEDDKQKFESQEAKTTAPKAAEQRPTRPLDLDPNRAQVPAENMRYIRHLGYSPPDFYSSKSPEEGHGWIHLNFLFNLAQLHDINVTPDFVRKAVSKMSYKLEMSTDGRKVRWKGSPKLSRTSSNDDGSSNDQNGTSTSAGESPRKRMKLSQNASGANTGNRTGRNSAHWLDRKKFVYTPLFHHKDSTDGDSSSSASDSESAASDDGYRYGDKYKNSTIPPVIAPKKKHDDGPIIFYNNARFCTDLSADRGLERNTNAPAYITSSLQPVGKARPKSTPMEKRGPLDSANELPEAMDLSDNPIPASLELHFPSSSSPASAGDSDGQSDDIPFEVSGIAGVWPSDNFAIRVEGRQTRVDQGLKPTATQRMQSKRPHRLSHVLKGLKSPAKPAIQHQVLSTDRKDLQPSQLPPPLGYLDSTSGSYNDDEESDFGDEMSVNQDQDGDLPPAITPQVMMTNFIDSDESDESSSEDDASSDDGEIDFLAPARKIAPEAIRANELEFDAAVAERLAEEIPAGSSAATAGGGSGFASPADGVNASGVGGSAIPARRAPRNKRGNLPQAQARAQSADSMTVHGPRTGADNYEEDSGDEEEDEEMDDVAS